MTRKVTLPLAFTDWRKSWQPFRHFLHPHLRRMQEPGRGGTQRLGCSMVPVQFLAPHRQAQSFLALAVCGSSSTMP